MPRTTTPTTTNGTPATNGTGNGHHEDAATKPAIEVALDKSRRSRAVYREAIRGLNELADTLKQVQREQKTTEKDVQSVRTTLENSRACGCTPTTLATETRGRMRERACPALVRQRSFTKNADLACKASRPRRCKRKQTR